MPCRSRGAWIAFQSTRPVWGATLKRDLIHVSQRISIHAPRVGRDRYSPVFLHCLRISIHAPRVGRDLANLPKTQSSCYFNPRAPCGARPQCCCDNRLATAFQSTRPVWGATRSSNRRKARHQISIHAPRVGRDPRTIIVRVASNISIHAPRVGRDHVCVVMSSDGESFQSTRPVWGATI